MSHYTFETACKTLIVSVLFVAFYAFAYMHSTNMIDNVFALIANAHIAVSCFIAALAEKLNK